MKNVTSKIASLQKKVLAIEHIPKISPFFSFVIINFHSDIRIDIKSHLKVESMLTRKTKELCLQRRYKRSLPLLLFLLKKSRTCTNFTVHIYVKGSALLIYSMSIKSLLLCDVWIVRITNTSALWGHVRPCELRRCKTERAPSSFRHRIRTNFHRIREMIHIVLHLSVRYCGDARANCDIHQQIASKIDVNSYHRNRRTTSNFVLYE